jgi:membrane-bound metal-dependent hydrolase YbcI (DUF457 family)
MNAHTHLLGGLALGVATLPLVHPAVALGYLALTTLAGPLPDWDHPGSTYGRYVPLPGVAKVHGHLEPFRRGPYGNSAASFGHVGRRTPFGILWHRGGAHSLGAAALAGLVVGGGLTALHVPDAATWGLAVGVGYVSHLLLDSLNVMGQSLAWPVTRRRFQLPWHFRMGGWQEGLVALALLGVVVVLGLPALPHLLAAAR